MSLAPSAVPSNVEAQTTTVVPPDFDLSVNELGYLDLRRRNREKTL